MQAGCRISSGRQSRDGRLSGVSRFARGSFAGRLYCSGLRGRRPLLAWFAGCSACRGAARTFAPENSCPPCLTGAGLRVGFAAVKTP